LVAIALCWLSVCSSGCGDSASPEQARALKEATLSVESPHLVRGLYVADRYKCSASKIWLPVRWSRVPRGASEIAVAISYSEIKRKPDGASESVLAGEALVGSLDPEIRSLSPGPPPRGAFLKQHEVGYCPPKGKESGVLVSVYALPRGQHLHRYEAFGLSTIEDLSHSTLAWGSTSAFYGG
jgi:hypothetical protein